MNMILTKSALAISITDISKYPLISENIVWTNFLFFLHFNSFHLKLLVSQSKFSGTRKFTLRYQYFELNSDFEVLIVD